mmetsp:Transcript_5927/g.17059  ORF Transcript_5927/g.17059 Transcript_5927/m.17059 type:complete len:428 (+) Transcript_5927:387-1670(+)
MSVLVARDLISHRRPTRGIARRPLIHRDQPRTVVVVVAAVHARSANGHDGPVLAERDGRAEVGRIPCAFPDQIVGPDLIPRFPVVGIRTNHALIEGVQWSSEGHRVAVGREGYCRSRTGVPGTTEDVGGALGGPPVADHPVHTHPRIARLTDRHSHPVVGKLQCPSRAGGKTHLSAPLGPFGAVPLVGSGVQLRRAVSNHITVSGYGDGPARLIVRAVPDQFSHGRPSLAGRIQFVHAYDSRVHAPLVEAVRAYDNSLTIGGHVHGYAESVEGKRARELLTEDLPGTGGVLAVGLDIPGALTPSCTHDQRGTIRGQCSRCSEFLVVAVAIPRCSRDGFPGALSASTRVGRWSECGGVGRHRSLGGGGGGDLSRYGRGVGGESKFDSGCRGVWVSGVESWGERRGVSGRKSGERSGRGGGDDAPLRRS